MVRIRLKIRLPPVKSGDFMLSHNAKRPPSSIPSIMKLRIIIAAIAASLVLSGGNVLAAEKADAKAEMAQLFQKIQTDWADYLDRQVVEAEKVRRLAIRAR